MVAFVVEAIVRPTARTARFAADWRISGATSKTMFAAGPAMPFRCGGGGGGGAEGGGVPGWGRSLSSRDLYAAAAPGGELVVEEARRPGEGLERGAEHALGEPEGRDPLHDSERAELLQAVLAAVGGAEILAHAGVAPHFPDVVEEPRGGELDVVL